MARYIICDCAKANWGKSTTLIAVNNLFASHPLQFTPLLLPFKPIYQNVCVYQDVSTKKVIWVQTDGDEAQAYQDINQYLLNGYNVDIIICPCRDHGQSKTALQHIANYYNFKQIFFSNFCPLNGIWSNQITFTNTFLLAQAIQQLALTL